MYHLMLIRCPDDVFDQARIPKCINNFARIFLFILGISLSRGSVGKISLVDIYTKIRIIVNHFEKITAINTVVSYFLPFEHNYLSSELNVICGQK